MLHVKLFALILVDCIPGPWSQWSVCSRNGRTCGYKWGVQTRTRQILQPSSPNGQACPALSRSQRCRLANRWCSGKCVGVVCPICQIRIGRNSFFVLDLDSSLDVCIVQVCELLKGVFRLPFKHVSQSFSYTD